MKRQNRKTLLSMILALSMILSIITALPISAGAETKSGKCGANLTWSLTDDGTLTISGTGRMDDYEQNKSPWYSFHTTIIKAILKDGVTSIGNLAFDDCILLKSVTLPNTLKSIGVGSFWACTNLSNINIPNSVESIGKEAFYECEALTSVSLPKYITSISVGMFDKCKSLAKITIPSGVTTISERGFLECKTLSNITIPKSVLSIGTAAFTWCDNIQNIYYESNQNDWDSISISKSGNYVGGLVNNNEEAISKATIHYNTPMDAPTITPTPNTVTPPPVTITPVPEPITPDITTAPIITPTPITVTPTPDNDDNNNNSNNIGGTTTIINNNTTNTIVTNNTATNNTVTNNTTTNNNITNNTSITNNITNNVSLVLYIGKTTASVGGESVENDVAPIVRNDRTMLPARFVAEQLGAKVDWNQDLKQVIITKGDKLITIPIGSDKAYINGEAQALDSPAFVESDRTYTPVRFIAENLDADVQWNGNDQSVTITEK